VEAVVPKVPLEEIVISRAILIEVGYERQVKVSEGNQFWSIQMKMVVQKSQTSSESHSALRPRRLQYAPSLDCLGIAA
jgi:hypothetical protein